MRPRYHPSPPLLTAFVVSALLALSPVPALAAEDSESVATDGVASTATEPAASPTEPTVPDLTPEHPGGSLGWRPPHRAQPIPSAALKPWWRRNLFGRWWSDQKFLVTTWWPAEARHWSFTGPIAGSILTASQSANDASSLDMRLARDAHEDSNGFSQTMFEGWTTLGNTATVAVGLGGSWLLGRMTGNERLRQASSLSAEALLDEALYVEGLKRITARTRPSRGGTGEFFVYNPPEGQSSTSFPSGHAMGAFTVATVFAHVYRDRRWVPWVAYGSATMVSVSRLTLGRHFASDLVVGGVLGNSFGRMVVARDIEADDERRPFASSHFEPIVDPETGGYGIGWKYSWGGARPAPQASP